MTPAVKSSSPSPNALRSRRSRRRRKQGLANYRIDIPIDDFFNALVASHRLTERQAQELRQPHIEAELAAVVADFIARWK